MKIFGRASFSSTGEAGIYSPNVNVLPGTMKGRGNATRDYIKKFTFHPYMQCLSVGQTKWEKVSTSVNLLGLQLSS